jgi:hypothetical protein
LLLDLFLDIERRGKLIGALLRILEVLDLNYCPETG